MKKVSLALLFGVLLSTFIATPSFAASSPNDSSQTTTGDDIAIGANTPTNGWLSMPFFEGRSGNAVLQRKTKGVGAAFRIYEGGKIVQEYSLTFPFKGRKADLKNTDFQLLTSCVQQFNSVAANPTGGDFYIQVNKDENLGVLCAANLTVAYK